MAKLEKSDSDSEKKLNKNVIFTTLKTVSLV